MHPAQAPPAAATLRVLVVDDSRDGADSLRMLLRLWGHEASAAYDGPSALEAAAQLWPHVVLLDLAMPREDGYEVARRLRELPGCAGALLLAVTGRGGPEDSRRSLVAGFHAHMVKPLDLTELRGLLARFRDLLADRN